MASRKVPVTFTFHQRGVQPPLFVAGSFSDPPWQPVIMDVSTDQHGEFMFVKQILVHEGLDYQYKFRLGEVGDWWAVDPDADTVNDDQGNVNNLLRVPVASTVEEDESAVHDAVEHSKDHSSNGRVIEAPGWRVETPPGKGKDPARPEDALSSKTAPIEETVARPAEIVDTVAPLGDIVRADDGSGLPMLTHECFTPFHDTPTVCEGPAHPAADEDGEVFEGLNYDDPRLEHFPADRDAILSTIRRLSTSVDVSGSTFTPVFSSSNLSNTSSPAEIRASLITDENERLQGLVRQREGVAASDSSLHSIAESDEVPQLHHSAGEQSEAKDCLTSEPAITCSKQQESTDASKDDLSTRPDDGKGGNGRVLGSGVDGNQEEVNGDSSSSWTTDSGTPRTDAQRVASPTSANSPQEPSAKGSWLGAIIHTLVYDWIGAFFYWLWGRGRNRGLPIGALIALGGGLLMWAQKDSLPWPGFAGKSIRL